MRTLKETKSYRVDTEKEAVDFIQQEKDNSMDGAYLITKASYTYKSGSLILTTAIAPRKRYPTIPQ